MRTALVHTRRRLAILALALLASGGATACLDKDLTTPRPSRLESEGGNGQTVEPLMRAANPLVVQVLDQYFNVMSGVTVKWAVVSGGGTVSSESTVTGADGLTQVFYTAGSSEGFVGVSATVEGLGTITFTLLVEAPTGS